MLQCKDDLEFLLKQETETIDLIYVDLCIPVKKSIRETMFHYHRRFLQMLRVLKKTGTIFLHCDVNLSHYFKVECDQIFGHKNFRNEIIWTYNYNNINDRNFRKSHHSIFRYTKSDKYYFSTPLDPGAIINKNCDGRIKSDVWYLPQVNKDESVEMNGVKVEYQKPLKLLELIVLSATRKNEVVADFCCGTGTTLVAAKKHGRKFIGCDIDPNAIALAERRLLKTKPPIETIK